MAIPKKRFGQHFLCDKNVIDQIIAAIDPKPDDHLVEIGPVEGALTIPLLKHLQHLEAIEFDRDLVTLLQKKCHSNDEFVLYTADALRFDFASLKKDKRLLRIVGNLPYNISTPLIFHLLTFSSVISDMTLMLQKEVAERLAASINTKAYGRLSVMVQYHCHVELLFTVPPHAFFPEPQVQSSMVRLIPHRHYPCRAENNALFEKIVKLAFMHRRKTLRNSLKDLIGDEAWPHLSIRSDLRAENLEVKDYVALSNSGYLSS